MSDLTVIIPHKPTPANDAALEINLAALHDNASCGLEVVVDDSMPGDPYDIWNRRIAELPKGRIVVMTNSDVIMGPRWDAGFLKHIQDQAILTGYIVEPGSIGVADANIRRDFGRLPHTFDRKAFEAFVENEMARTPDLKIERAWYMPCCLYRDFFVWTKGFNLSGGGFPRALDIEYWERCIKHLPNFKLLRVNSWSYHFQNLSYLEASRARGDVSRYV